MHVPIPILVSILRFNLSTDATLNTTTDKTTTMGRSQSIDLIPRIFRID